MNEADKELAARAECTFGVFTNVDAIEAGLTAEQCVHRIRSGRWIVIHRGVYRMPGSSLSPKGALLAGCRAGAPGALASHRSAAHLWDLPGGRDDLVEISCPRWHRAQQVGLVIHETTLQRQGDRAEVDGIPVTGVARTLLDLGAVCRPAVVEMAVDRALRLGLVRIARLRALLEDGGRRGRNGTAVLRAIVEQREPGQAPSESEMETMLRRVLRRHGLAEPVPQYVIRDRGRFVARVDFAYPAERIAIEYDSLEHHSDRRAHIRDNARRNQIVALDWSLVVATVEDVRGGGHELVRAICSCFGVRNLRPRA